MTKVEKHDTLGRRIKFLVQGLHEYPKDGKMKRTYRVKLKTRSKRVQDLLKRCAGVYRKSFNITSEFQFEATLLRGSLRKFLSGAQTYEALEVSKYTFSFLENFDKGIYKAAVFDSAKAFKRNFDFHVQNIPFLSRKKTTPYFRTFGNVRITDDAITLPKVGRIPLYERGRIPLAKKYSNISFSFDGNNWFISVDVEEPSVKVELTEQIVTLDFTKDGSPVINGKVKKSIVNSREYTKEERKLRRALKKLKRQTTMNAKSHVSGRLIPVTTRNMKKTQRLVDKKRVRLYNMRKDYFFKVVNEVAITKPKELHILSNSSIRAQRGGYLSRAQRIGGSADFLRMMSKRLGIMGTRVLRHVSTSEFPKALPRL